MFCPLPHTVLCDFCHCVIFSNNRARTNGKNPQRYDMTQQKKGRWELRSSADGFHIKGILPTRHRALEIGNLKQQIWGKQMVRNLEGGRIIFWHNSVLKQLLPLCNCYSFCSKLFFSTLEFSALRYSQIILSQIWLLPNNECSLLTYILWTWFCVF